MILKDFISACDENLMVVLWDAKSEQFIGEYYQVDHVGQDLVDHYATWKVVKIQGSGKGYLIDILLEEV